MADDGEGEALPEDRGAPERHEEEGDDHVLHRHRASAPGEFAAQARPKIHNADLHLQTLKGRIAELLTGDARDDLLRWINAAVDEIADAAFVQCLEVEGEHHAHRGRRLLAAGKRCVVTRAERAAVASIRRENGRRVIALAHRPGFKLVAAGRDTEHTHYPHGKLASPVTFRLSGVAVWQREAVGKR